MTIKVPDVIRKKLDAIGKKLNYINRVLPGGLFVADSDGKIELLGIIDPNSKSRIFPDLKDGGL